MPAVPPRHAIPQLAQLELRIETPRLVLRPFRETDVEDIWPVVSNPEFPKLMSWAAHVDRSETLTFVRRIHQALADNAGVTWAVEHDGRVIGSIGLHSMTFGFRAWRIDRGELGFWIAPSQWNKGYVTEAADAVIRYAFETIGLHKVTVGCLEENAATRRVIEKLGFRFIGRLEDDVWRDGAWHTVVRFELTPRLA